MIKSISLLFLIIFNIKNVIAGPCTYCMDYPTTQIPNGYFYGPNPPVSNSSVLYVGCDYGYQLSPSSPGSFPCINGVWKNINNNVCQKVFCIESPPLAVNATYTSGAGGYSSNGTVATSVCSLENGYVAVGNMQTICVNTKWTTITGYCKYINCHVSPSSALAPHSRFVSNFPSCNSIYPNGYSYYYWNLNYPDTSYLNSTYCPTQCETGYTLRLAANDNDPSLTNPLTISCVYNNWVSNHPGYQCVQTSCFDDPPFPTDLPNWYCDHGYPYQNLTTCYGSCSDAYEQVPSTVTTQCISNKWTSVPAHSCVLTGCLSQPPAIANGYYYNCDSDSYSNQTTCSGTCSDGFVLSGGSLDVTCLGKNIGWTQPTGYCVQYQCLTDPEPPLGTDIDYCTNGGAPYNNQTKCYFYCRDGNTVADGVFETTCDGKDWSIVNATCRQNSCYTNPPIPLDYYYGYIYSNYLMARSNCTSGTPYDAGTVCTSTCQPFQYWNEIKSHPSTGSNFITKCDGKTGSWSQITGHCVPDDCVGPITIPRNEGETVGTCRENVTSGTSCEFECAPTYTINPDMDRKVGVCYASHWFEKEVYDYRDYYDYDYSGTSMCEQNCADIESIIPGNGTRGSCYENFPGGSGCVLGCDQQNGYFPDGDMNVWCDSGSWSTNGPSCTKNIGTTYQTCKDVPCVFPHMNTGNCQANSASGTICHVGCNSGYKNLGNLNITCTDGEWSFPTGECVAIATCAGLPYLEDNLEYTSSCVANSPIGSKCQLKCKNGYFMESESIHSHSVCQSNGEWTYLSDRCQELSCVNNPIVPSGGILGECYPSMESDSSCYMGCDNAHTQLGGDLLMNCNLGQWSADPDNGHCEANCPNLPPLPANTLLSYGSCHPNFPSSSGCTTKCPVGYALGSGSFTATCKNGAWTSVPTAVCVPSTKAACAYPPNSPGGSDYGTCPSSGSQFSSGTSCSFSCPSYTTKTPSDGSLTVTCNDGEWSETTAECWDNCNKYNIDLHDGQNYGTCDSVNFPNGQHCELDCDAGYKKVGDMTFQCKYYNGYWDDVGDYSTYYDYQSDGTCEECPSGTCNQCTSPPSVSDAYVVPSNAGNGPWGTGSTIDLSCATGFNVSSTGTLEVTCTNGAWSTPTAACKDASKNGKSSATPAGAIAGAVIGAVVGVALLAGVAIYMKNKGGGRKDVPMSER